MWILLIVFAVCFAVVILVEFALFAPASKELEHTVSRLEGLHSPQNKTTRENIVSVRREERLSTMPWLNEFLRKVNFSGRLSLLLCQAELNWNVGRLLLSTTLLSLLFGYPVYYRTHGFLLSVITAACAGAAPFLYVLRKRDKRFDQMRQFLPEALDLMVAAIRAGHSFSSAMGMASKESPEPIRREFRQCFDEQNYGLELRAALSNLQQRMPIEEVRMIVTALMIQSESGGNLTEILEKVAYLVRENFRLRRQVQVHTAQGRISGWVLTGLPVVIGFLLYLINPKQMSVLWVHPMGRKLMYVAIMMTAIGGILIRKIVRIRI
jgi:tight adherence protein B